MCFRVLGISRFHIETTILKRSMPTPYLEPVTKLQSAGVGYVPSGRFLNTARQVESHRPDDGPCQ